MAEKVIAIKIDVQGTADQNKKLVGLEKNLKKLKDERTKLNKAVKDGVISTDQYAKSIAKVNLGLKGTQRQLLVTRQEMLGIDGFTTRLGKSFGRLGNQISGAFVGLFAVQKFFEVIKGGIQTIEEFEQQMATTRAISGATKQEFEALTESAKELGRVSQFTATQVGKLQEEYAKLGFTTAEILAASEATLLLATATGSDLAQSAEVAASTLNGFGLAATDTQKVVDLMAESFSSTPLDINKFQESMKLVAPTAKSVGESVQDATAKLGLLAKNGISGSLAGTQLNRVFIELNKKGLTLEQAMEKVSNSTNKLGTATELVGDRGAKALQIFADQSDELDTLTQSFSDSAGEAEKMADIVGDTSVGATKKLDSAWEGLLITIGDGSEDGFKKAKLAVADFLNTYTDAVTEITDLRDSGFSFIETQAGFRDLELQKEVLAEINKEREFLNKNISDKVAIDKKIIELSKEGLLIQKQAIDADSDELDRLDKLTRVKLNSLKNLQEQSKALKEKAAAEVVASKAAEISAELESESVKKLTTLKLSELKKLNTEESKAEIKRRKDRDKKIADDKKAAERKAKDDERAAERSLKIEEGFISKVDDIRKQSSLLAIEDERKLQLEKLRIQKEALDAEAKLKIEGKVKQDNALLSLTTSFKAKEDSINASFDEKQRVLDEAALEQTEAAKQKKIDDIISVGQFALTAATELVSSIASIELQTEREKLEKGLITEKQFAVLKYGIEKKAFERQKKIDITQAIMNGALGVTKAFAQSGVLGAVTGASCCIYSRTSCYHI